MRSGVARPGSLPTVGRVGALEVAVALRPAAELRAAAGLRAVAELRPAVGLRAVAELRVVVGLRVVAGLRAVAGPRRLVADPVQMAASIPLLLVDVVVLRSRVWASRSRSC